MSENISFKIADPAKPLVLVPAYINGQGPYDFILDTGAGTTVLSKDLAEELGIEAGESKEARGAGGGLRVTLSRANSFSVGASEQKNVEVALLDMNELSKNCGIDKLAGIVGYNYLKKYTVTIRYPDSVLQLN